MKADYIEMILSNAEKLPYRCILFDGPWGIGKTYTVNKSLKKYENVCKMSMFGLQNSNQIYHEALFQTALKRNMGGKLADYFLKVINSIAKVWNKSDIAKDIISSITNERDIFLQMARQFKALHIIVIDDLERISDKVVFERVLGVIEELKQCNFIKVILIANIEELPNENRSLFDKYNEKVIDRIYRITEMPHKVNWEDLGMDNEFIVQFLSKHAVKNLRTLQKAQNFYNDVRLYCAGINDEKFLNEIKLICFAIVVEPKIPSKLYTCLGCQPI